MTEKPVFLIWADGADYFARCLTDNGLSDRVELHIAAPDQMPDDGLLQRVDALYAKFLPAGILEAMPKLRWLQAEAAGVDRFLKRPDLRENITLVSGRGIHRLQMPDTILGSLFYTTKQFKRFSEQQSRCEWNRFAPHSVAGQTLTIFGLGAIGKELARKASALDMRVLGVNRSGAQVDHVEQVYSFADRHAALAQADHVVLVLPLTPETGGMVDKNWLEAMKPGAWLHNFSRGQMIVDDDLLAATETGVIAGAVLDAFREEPLPENSPFWHARNVVVLPHIGGLHPERERFIGEMMVSNLAGFLSGEPSEGEVSRALGY